MLKPSSQITKTDVSDILDNLISKRFKSVKQLLKSLVDGIVKSEHLNITGGRIWELNKEEKCYNLNYQTGSAKKIPEGHKQSLDQNHIYTELSNLLNTRSIIADETDEILIGAGVKHFAVTGLGELYRLDNGKYYEYLISFNIDEHNEEFNETLNVISTLTTLAIRNLMALSEKSRIDKDIKKASEIQQNLLPDHYIEFHDYKIFGICIPDRGVGGDFFDYIKNSYDYDDEQLTIVIGDAASKGLPAAIQALFVAGALRMGMSLATKLSHVFSLLNNLVHSTFPSDRFVSLFTCELTISSNRMVLYVNAGHSAPIHYRPTTKRVKRLEATGTFIGVMEQQKFAVENVRMYPGDILLLFTDGIDEAQDENGTLFGTERLVELLDKHHRDTPKNIAFYIIEEVQKFSAKSIYTDDRTLVVIKRDDYKL